MAGEGVGVGNLRPLGSLLTGLMAPLGIMAGLVKYWPQAKLKARASSQTKATAWLGCTCPPPRVMWELRLGHGAGIQRHGGG